MRILDENGNEMESYDEYSGYTIPEVIDGKYHEAQEEVQQQSHYVTIAEYPETGGKDVEEVIDVPYQPAREAWYEKEEILRYHPYAEEEIKRIKTEKEKAESDQMKINSLTSSDLTFSDIVDAIATITYGGA